MVLESSAPIETEPLRRQEVPMPEPGEFEVRIRVRACGICRTDLHVIEGELPVHRRPLVPGHQIVGVVDKVGAQSHRFALGARIGVAWLRYTCGHCGFCRSGKENLCPDSQYTGYDANGGFAEYAVIHESYAYEIPALDYTRHLFYEKNVHSVTANTRQDGLDLFAEAAKIPLRPQTKTYRLQEANQALQDLKGDRIQGTGVLLIGN